jgi:hypothetical protein
MIVRIQGEGQFRLDDSGIQELNLLDDALEASLDQGESEFQAALDAIEGLVRHRGSRLADDELVESDVVLPPSDASADEVRSMLNDDGLISG